jgi:hypothetical protein
MTQATKALPTNSTSGTESKTAAPAGKETQPDNSKCEGTTGKDTGFTGNTTNT